LTYIVVALKSEAQAFVDKYKLHKSKLDSFTYFYSDSIKLIISNIGVDNSRNATQTLINQYDITDEDLYLNIGICGASPLFEIGSLIEINTLRYKDISYKINDGKNIITCVDEAMSEDTYNIVDMESFGFYDAVIHNPAIKQFHILKIVSDHFEPQTVTKDATKKLIFNKIDAINKIINS